MKGGKSTIVNFDEHGVFQLNEEMMLLVEVSGGLPDPGANVSCADNPNQGCIKANVFCTAAQIDSTCADVNASCGTPGTTLDVTCVGLNGACAKASGGYNATCVGPANGVC